MLVYSTDCRANRYLHFSINNIIFASSLITMSLFLLPPHKLQRCPYSFPSVSASLDPGVKIVTECNAVGLGTKERIRELFNKVELSVSSYDTAWVAMVPSPNSSQAPCFPECVNWILDNQLCDGSWGLPQHHSLLIKDLLTSTLACILALKQWGVGEEQINNGLQFIELNSTSLTDENQHHPIGFDIIFPGMLKYANELNLNLPLEPTDLDAMLRKREVELSRGHLEGRKAYLAYVSEGMGKLQDWGMVMEYQRKNGSLFNSPSTTAAAFTHLHNADCLNYLHSVLEKFGNAVPTIYPLDIYSRLCMVDSLERLGIERHFRKEIRSVLDETYRCWLQREEEIFMDIATCAMAFRVLRLNGYDVSSDSLTQFIKEEHDFDITRGHLKDIGAALELYRASQIIIYPDESALDKQNSWSNDFLQQKFHKGSIHVDRLNKYLIQEVDDALKFPFHANLERTANRRNIEHYNVDSTRILKTSYRSSNISNEDFLKLAVEDFNICQSIHREELKQLERCIYLSSIKGDDVGTSNFYEIFYEGKVKQWHVSHDSRELGNELTANFTVFACALYNWWVVENRLDQLKFARQKSAYCYFSAAATLFSPELSDARMSWAKNGVLTTVVDDFFDIGGSLEELENLIHLVEKWDVNIDTNCCSEKVQIIFSALHSTICEIGGKAFRYQGRSVTRHIIEIWLDLLGSMLREAEWVRNKSVPTIDEYMTNGYVSFALGPIVLPALYFVGPKLSEEVISNPECHNLFKIMSTCGRLLNDIHSFKRESKEGKLNAVSLYMINNIVTEKEAIGEMKSFIDSRRRELLRLILQKKVSVVPRECKDLFWKMSKVLHLFYMKDDGFTSHEMISAVKAIIHEPISLSLCK